MFILKNIFGKRSQGKETDITILNEVSILDDRAYKDTRNQEEKADIEEYEIVEIEILPEKIICPDCGGITLQGLDFCDKCAGELQ